MSKKKIIFNVIFFLAVTGLTIYYLISSKIINSFSEIGNISWWGFLFIAFLVFAFVTLDSFIMFRNMRLIHKDAKFMHSYGTYLMGNLGSNVTPWKSGHFPMMGYYLTKKGYNAEEMLSSLATNQIIYSMVLPPLYTIFLIYSLVNQSTLLIGEVNVPLYIFCIIGIVTNIGYFVVLMFLMYNQKFQGFILKIEVKILKKFKKNFNEDEFVQTKKYKMEIYKISANRMYKNIRYNIPSIITYILFMIVRFGLPYFIYISITKEAFSIDKYMYSFLLCQASSYVTNIIPSPGGIGSAEFSFITAYKYFMGDSVNLAVIIYRISTFLGLVIIDFIFFTIFLVKDMVKKKKQDFTENENNCFENE